METNTEEFRRDDNWAGAFASSFNQDYLVDFMLPVTSLCLTLISIMVEL